MANKVINFKFNFDTTGFKQSMDKVVQSFNGLEDKVKKSSQKLKDIGNSTKEAGDKLSGMSAGFTAIGAASVGSSITIQNALSKMKANLGGTEAEIKANEVAFKNLAKKGVGDFETIGLAITSVKQNMGDLKGKELETMSTQAIQLAELFDEDVNSVVKAAGIMMKNFGITGSAAFDLITVGQQKGLNANGEMLDTFSEYSVQFATMGLTAEQMTNVLVAGMEEGSFSVDKVADSFKEFGLIVRENSDETKLAFKELGLNADETSKAFSEGGESSANAMTAVVSALSTIENDTEKNRLGVALFGTQWEDTGARAVEALGITENKLGNVKGAAEETSKSAEGIGDKFRGAMNTIMLSLEPLANSIIPIIERYLPMFINKITELANGFNNLSPAQKDFLVYIGGFLAIAAPFLSILGTIIGGLGTLGTFIVKIVGLFKALGLAVSAAGIMSVGTFALIAGGLVALVAVFILWGDDIMNFFKKLFSWLGEFIVNSWNSIVSFTVKFAPKMLDVISGMFLSMVNGAMEFGSTIFKLVTSPFRLAYEVIRNIFNDILGFFDIKLRFPKIEMPKLPHFSLTGGFSLSPPRVPKLDVDWYKTGGIATGPSVVGIGEAGTEAILPLSNKQYMKPLASTIAEFINNNGNQEVKGSRVTEIKNNTFVIREEADISKIAKELHELEKEQERLNGI